MASVDAAALEGKIASLLSVVRENDSPESWSQITQVCRSIANSLRTRGEGVFYSIHFKSNATQLISRLVDNHEILGKSALPQSLAALIPLALHGAPVPPDEYTAPICEMLRVSANLCLDHGTQCSVGFDRYSTNGF
jgi:hypothetical protein